MAWIHAQQALDVLDLATTPNVTVTTREDMPHEGNVTYAVRGHVFDVRTHELALALSLNGANRTLNLSVNTMPGAIGTFETNVTLSRQVNEITVSATDPNRRWSPDYGGENRTVGRDVLRLDGDLLPDTYEEQVTGTDPLSPDSNASQTSFNESGNNITDGAEDFDNDGETAAQAYWFDLDPLDNDTDGDRLQDGFELQFQALDPLDTDSDNDTVRDPAEDLDNDSLSNRREQTAGTNPVENDTDGDTLNDSAELANETDPLSPDTDSDGLRDPDEYEVGTDPTDPDTDGDGVLDSDETFATETTDEETGVTVNVTGEGNVAGAVSVNTSSRTILETASVQNVSASGAYDFETTANFSTATISLPYNDSRVSAENETTLGAYRYNETLQTFVAVTNSTVDTRNDTVTAETPHFSTYTVLSTETWESRFDRALPDKWSNTDNFSTLDGWEEDGNVSTATVDRAGVATSDAASEESAAVVGSLTREQTERNWSKPSETESETTTTSEGSETTTTVTATTTETVSGYEYCEQSGPESNWGCEPTEEPSETTEEEVSNPDPKVDSDGDGTYDRYDDCPATPGENNGCPQHSDNDGIKDYNDECDNKEGYGDGCPTHSDADEVSDFHDECPNTPGVRENGCAKNTDGDDYNDFFDDCPDEPGTLSNGCPTDDDGDNTRNYYDDCPQFPGWKPNGCPRESSLERTVTLRDAETVTLGVVAKANAISHRSVAELVVIGPDGERTRVYGEDNTYASTESVRESQLGAEAVLPGGGGDAHGDFEAVEHDLSEYAGEQVTIKIETVGRATFEIDALKLGYDTDGDTLYDAVERGTCGLRDGRGQCLDTDPRLADTDGDGLSDSYEVGERQQVHGREYHVLVSNPTERDTDHDGLSDAQELRGFDTAVTQSPDASRKYLNGESPSDKAEHLTTEWTNSNPFAYDSDNDGLSDREEWLHKTDPTNPDSDGDGLLDGRERAVGEDPTLHDYRPPDIRLARYGYLANYSEMEIEYILEYLLFDPSGVEHTAVEKNGKTRYQSSPNAVFSRHDGSFSVSGVSAVSDELAGATVEVTATDSHGNRKKTVGIRKANAVGRLAGKLDADTMYATGAAEKLGALSGFSAGMGGTIKSLLGLVNDPLGFVKGLTGLIDLLDESGLLGMFLDAMVSSLQDKQKTNNPYAEGSALYDEYRNSWYAGYTVAFITKAIAGAQATKVVKSSTYAQKVSNFAKSTRAGKAAMRVKAPYDRGKARAATGLARATDRASGPLLRRAKSAGATYRLWRLQREGEVDTSDLSDIERDRVVRYLARHGEDGAEDLREMDDVAIQRMFRKTCSSGGIGSFGRAGGGCTPLSDEELRDYAVQLETQMSGLVRSTRRLTTRM
ncbi:hypothetical protein [Halorussus caseinilyticus]|uniref:Uncharacterized protein n=1 Tax=Halorussus caseinilyticus TaxID=3034025 RepID=A0ABD5WMT1_9EURY